MRGASNFSVIFLEEFLCLITEKFLAPLRGRVERFAKQFLDPSEDKVERRDFPEYKMYLNIWKIPR